MAQLLKMALRDLGRNKRRSILSALAVSVGVALLLLMAAIVSGEMRGALQNTIQLQSGHLQIRAASYDENKVSLKWEDLIASPQTIVAKLENIPQVAAASPRLFASGIVTLGENSRGVQVVGVDPNSATSDPFRVGLVAGQFIQADDREGVVVGKPLAEKFKLKVGDKVSLLINKSDGGVDEQIFFVRGIYTTNTSGYDENTLFMPLTKAQTFAGAENHASTIFIMLKDREQAEAVAAALQTTQYKILTWREMNALIVQTEDFSRAYMMVLYLIVLAITATVVSNTLIMAVFERTREIGVLTAIGMKSLRVMAMFLTEATFLATGGVVGGLILGGVAVAYFTTYGIYIGDMGITGMLMSDTIYAYLTVSDTIMLSIAAYVVTLIASIYPATVAARMEPVEALHG
jgi:ABC-type lipoprotein release transport system permease subunit